MKVRKFLQVAFAALLIAGATQSPAFMSISNSQGSQTTLLDGGFPPPVECGLYDICRVS